MTKMTEAELQAFLDQHMALYMQEEMAAAVVRVADRMRKLIVSVVAERAAARFVNDYLNEINDGI